MYLTDMKIPSRNMEKMVKRHNGIAVLLKLTLITLVFPSISAMEIGQAKKGFQVPVGFLDPNETPWIGSHSLDFTKNPFLKSTADSDASKPAARHGPVMVTVTPSTEPTFPPVIMTEVPKLLVRKGSSKNKKKGKKQHKPKGRKRLTQSTRATRNLSKMENAKRRLKLRRRIRFFPAEASTVVNETVPLFPAQTTPSSLTNEFNQNIVKFLPVDNVSLNPSFSRRHVDPTVQPGPMSSTTMLPAANNPIEIINVTTSLPSRLAEEGNDLDKNMIPTEYLNHPENLNPSFFRNIILKTMMDKLVTVGIATHAPKMVRRNQSRALVRAANLTDNH